MSEFEPSKNRSTTAHMTEAQLLRVGEVAAILNISVRTLWRLAASERFPQPIRVGGSTRWRRLDVQQWIDRECQPVRSRKRDRRNDREATQTEP